MARWSLLVIADTQYLFDGKRQRPELLAESFTEVARLVAAGALAPIRHAIHVGDVTEHGWPEECAPALTTLRAGLAEIGSPALTVATGNHDVAHHSDDSRGPTDFLASFGPGCPLLTGQHLASEVVHDATGYSSWRAIKLPEGTELGVLALDWRPATATLDWARQILRDNPIPTVLVSHETAFAGELTDQGKILAALVADQPQVFLVLGGHHWPSTRVRLAEREYHAVNYQQLPFGGAGAVRVYDFDEDSGYVQAITLCPARTRPEVVGSVAARRQLAFSGPDDQFAFRPYGLCNDADDLPWQARGLPLVAEFTGQPREAQFDLPSRFVIEVVAQLPEKMSRDWQTLLARLGPAPDGSAEPLAALSLSTENFVAWQGYVDSGETWANSHEIAPGSLVRIVVANGSSPGLWVDDDPSGRVDEWLGAAPVPGPRDWRIGAGQYAGRYADPFAGKITRVRVWGR